MRTGAIDIGGTSVKYGLVSIDAAGPTLATDFAPVVLPSNDFVTLRGIVVKAANDLRKEFGVDRIGISTSGSVDKNEVVVSAGLFDGYANVSWADVLRAEADLARVAVANDGRAAAWAEFSAASAGDDSLIHAVVGTGVGGGIVYNRELLLGDSGQSGYIGHIKVTQQSPIECSCGSRGCVESLSSARAIAAAYASSTGSHTGVPLESVVQRAASGDAHALDAFRQAAWWLGYGLGDAMNVINPALVTIGGGTSLATEVALSSVGESLLSHVTAGVKAAAHKRVFATAEIRLARFGNDGGMLGAALLASR